MVTGVTAANMTNVLGTAVVPAQLKETPLKSDRRSNKPIMEKRRRARINNCLNELKTLILDATKKDPARHSKLEKADILEKTVKHLQELQRQQAAMQQAADPKIVNKFKAGFADCVNEVSRFPGIEPAQRRRLLQHLSNCINGVKTELHQQQRQQQQQSIHAQMLPSPPSSPEQDSQQPTAAAAPYLFGQIQQTASGYFLPNGMQVIPTKLPNGSIALVLPQSLPQQQQQQLLQHQHQQQQQQQQQLAVAAAAAAAVAAQQQQQQPLLVAMPQRTASTGSASSHSSAGYESAPGSSSSSRCSYAPPSPANSSYEPMDIKPSVIQRVPMDQQPLSLVIKKQIKEEEQPWRPW
ncbi:protein hairy [Drosophila elegans]|uniref:protein hairy n=1 Tax=Drosophila elegans TaxID=30023 RepID=UPI0007E6190C|nr:protein hairy [Drosophila elegans]